jgi:hypothetical protein
MLLFLFKTSKSAKTKVSISKKEEIPIRYNILPKTSPQYPGDRVKYKVTVINDKLDQISGRVTLMPPEEWNMDPLVKEYGPLNKEASQELEFEFQIPKDAQMGFIYKVAGKISYGSEEVESSAMIELVKKGEELLW